MERIRLATTLAVCLIAAGQAAAASCDLGHAPQVPVVKGLPYKEARETILAGGWQKVPGKPHNDLSDNETNFRERGYTELQFCRLDADSLCRFAFSSPTGVMLWITTAGDENAALGTQAIVKSAKLSCAADGDPG
jgi:hypothetical protein